MPDAIRLAAPDDAPTLLAIYAPIVEDTVISFERTPPTEEAFRERIARTLQKWPWLVCERSGMVTGYAYAGPYRQRAAYQWSAESSVYVHEDYRRQGVGTGLYTTLFGLLAAQGYFNVYAGTALPNRSSVALHQAFGFEAIGTHRRVGYKLGAWRDVMWWQLTLRDDRSAPPSPPQPASDLVGSPAWEHAIRDGLACLSPPPA